MTSVKRVSGIKIGGQLVGKPSGVGKNLDWYGTVDFDRDAFTAALKDKGYDVIWEKATFCPNRASARGRGGLAPKDHRINCQICDGSGYLYYSSTPTQMLMTSMNLSQNFYAYGRFDSGTQMVTALPEQRLHPFDRLTLCNGVARFQDIVRRQPETLSDSLKYAPLCVENVSWVDRDGALATFKDSTHFTTIEEVFTWRSATDSPDANDYYTISYTYRPRYIVIELPHQHRDSTIDGTHYEFPVQAMARLDYLLRDESKDAPEADDQPPFPPHR